MKSKGDGEGLKEEEREREMCEGETKLAKFSK